MKNKLLAILCLSFFGLSVFAQNLSNDYKVIHVGKQVKDIAYENPCASPLENYVARMHLWIEGKYDTIYSETVDEIARQSNQPYPQKAVERLLNSEIEQMITYKDSIGLVFRLDKNDPGGYFVGTSRWENGKWLGSGEDVCYKKSMNETTQYIEDKSVENLNRLRKYYLQKIVSTDTLAFINYLKQHGGNPKTYLLEKLTTYPLVIYGEIHRRKPSWDFLKSLIRDPDFVKKCGTVFMELPYYNQPLFDKLLQNDTLDATTIFKILGSEQQYGWQDKGEFEFITEIWKINQHTDNKIRIVPVDFQINWDSIKTKRENDYWTFIEKNFTKDRDSTMAEIIYSYLKNKSDGRNCLFIVGQEHARKSSPNKPVKAGTLLKKLMGNNSQMQIFSTISHAMISDNANWLGKVRYGLFDYIFEKTGNVPIAFDLGNSIFGKEPFDASQNVRFEQGCGNYEDFYDGYIFLCPLAEEPYDYELKELYTDDFVEELKRRAFLSNDREAYYGIPVDSLTKEKIHEQMDSGLQQSNNKKYWMFYKK
ncbi:MAG: hypothetical protein LBQ28_04370 [Prevotellaceae bacterium]|jgi:hypothetical protein|nr:hypothetical protein [Prevotellaceae bacterium]